MDSHLAALFLRSHQLSSSLVGEWDPSPRPALRVEFDDVVWSLLLSLITHRLLLKSFLVVYVVLGMSCFFRCIISLPIVCLGKQLLALRNISFTTQWIGRLQTLHWAGTKSQQSHLDDSTLCRMSPNADVYPPHRCLRN